MIWSVEVLLCIHNGIPSVPPASAPCSASRAPQTLGAMPRKNRGGKAKAGAEVEATATYIAGVMQQPENVMAAPAVGKISVEMPSAVVGVEGAFELAEGTASVSAKEVSPATEQKEQEAALAGKREADTALMKLKAAEAEVCVCARAYSKWSCILRTARFRVVYVHLYMKRRLLCCILVHAFESIIFWSLCFLLLQLLCVNVQAEETKAREEETTRKQAEEHDKATSEAAEKKKQLVEVQKWTEDTRKKDEDDARMRAEEEQKANAATEAAAAIEDQKAQEVAATKRDEYNTRMRAEEEQKANEAVEAAAAIEKQKTQEDAATKREADDSRMRVGEEQQANAATEAAAATEKPKVHEDSTEKKDENVSAVRQQESDQVMMVQVEAEAEETRALGYEGRDFGRVDSEDSFCTDDGDLEELDDDGETFSWTMH